LTSVCRRWKVTRGTYLCVGSARRSIRFDAPARHPDTEAFRGKYSAPSRAKRTLGGAGGRDECGGAPVRYVSPFFRLLRCTFSWNVQHLIRKPN